MAFTAPPPGSIAARPPVRKGGVRAADESPKDFGMRMSGRQASAAIAPPPPPSRRDNIIAARADGSFGAKRDAFNAGTAQHGRSMDEAGNITGTGPQSTGGQLVPGRSTGSMVWKPNTPTTSTAAPAPVPLAAPAAAPPAATPTAAPATSPAPAAIAPPPPPAAKAPASPAPITPPGTGPIRPPATPQTNALMGRLNTSMAPPPPPGASPAQPAPAAPAATTPPVTQPPPQGAGAAKSAPAPAPALPPPASPAGSPPVNNTPSPSTAQPSTPAAPPPPPTRKPGMINDGNGWKPASEVNAGLRAAQDARAAQSIAPPPPPKPSTASTPSPAPGVMNQAAVDAHWTPERRAASRAEEKRILDERQAKEEKAGLDRATKPKLKTDAEYATEAKRRAQLADIEMWQKAREAAEKMNRGNSFGPGPGMHTDYDADPKTGELIEKTVHSKTGVVISEKRHKSLAYSGQKPFNDQWSKPPAPSTVVGR